MTYTNEQLAAMCDHYAVQAYYDHADGKGHDQLRAAARTLRAMQGKEQSSAAAGTIASKASRESDVAGSAADPPPPEDALLDPKK